MNNKENMKKAIIKDFDKKNNYNMIIDKIDNKSNRTYLKYSFVPIILVILVLIVLQSQKSNHIKEFKEENLNVSTTSSSNSKDYDNLNNNSSTNIVFNELKDYKSKQDNSKNYLNNINIPYFEILSNIEIPNDFDILFDGRGVCITIDKQDRNYGKINNYELWYRNSKNNRRIVIALSEKNIPYREFIIDKRNIKKTIINNVEVEIYKYKNIYVSMFNYKGYNFDIESCDIIEEEYTKLLYSIIK